MVVKMTIVEIKNLNFSFKNKIIFEHLDLNFKDHTITTVMGANGSGKSILAHLIYDNYAGINVNANNIKLVTTNPCEQIVSKTVKEQLMFYLKQTNLDKEEIDKRVSKIVKDFELNDLINCDPYDLDYATIQLIVVLSNIITYPELIIFDDAMTFISNYFKKKIFDFLKKNKVSIINFTNDSEECLYGNHVVVLNKKVVLNKTLKSALKEEKIFLDNRIVLPFMAELSNKLKYYGLIDEIILDMDMMVKKIWN